MDTGGARAGALSGSPRGAFIGLAGCTLARLWGRRAEAHTRRGGGQAGWGWGGCPGAACPAHLRSARLPAPAPRVAAGKFPKAGPAGSTTAAAAARPECVPANTGAERKPRHWPGAAAATEEEEDEEAGAAPPAPPSARSPSMSQLPARLMARPGPAPAPAPCRTPWRCAPPPSSPFSPVRSLPPSSSRPRSLCEPPASRPPSNRLAHRGTFIKTKFRLGGGLGRSGGRLPPRGLPLGAVPLAARGHVGMGGAGEPGSGPGPGGPTHPGPFPSPALVQPTAPSRPPPDPGVSGAATPTS